MLKCSSRVESAAKQVISESIRTKVTSWDSFEILEQLERNDTLWCLVRVKYKAQNLYGVEVKQDNLVCFFLYNGEVIYHPRYALQSTEQMDDLYGFSLNEKDRIDLIAGIMKGMINWPEGEQTDEDYNKKSKRKASKEKLKAEQKDNLNKEEAIANLEKKGYYNLEKIIYRDGLTIDKVKEKYPWLQKAKFRGTIIGECNDSLVMYDGAWDDGIWECGIWEGKAFYGGIWKGGRWKNGVMGGGIWENGVWEGGLWDYGTWKGGKDKNGKFHPAGDSPDKW